MYFHDNFLETAEQLLNDVTSTIIGMKLSKSSIHKKIFHAAETLSQKNYFLNKK